MTTYLLQAINPETGKPRFEFVAGSLCLDFCNTINFAGHDQNERLKTYTDLVLWGQFAGALDERQAISLVQWGGQNPKDAYGSLSHARDLRAVLHRLFVDMARGIAPLRGDLEGLNKALGPALSWLRIVQEEEDFTTTWDPTVFDPGRMLWPAIRSAMNLLIGEEIHHVCQCSGDGCGWLFLDLSRNHSRRWCSMEHCGNRMRVRRFYRRNH